MEASSRLDSILRKATAAPRALTVEELEALLSPAGSEARARIRAAALAVRRRATAPGVAVRGLIEVGNLCAKDCFYCGIRKSNAAISRYRYSEDDVARMAKTCAALGYASVVLQGGEVESEANTAFVERCLRRLAPLGLGVTLSFGEQEESVYRRWREAGATRYLLRIETASPTLYATLHPADCSWSRRVECLRALRRCGYQVGTGTMIGLPGQTVADRARDVRFFGEIDADMIGMGPYIPHPDTPLGAVAPALPPETRLEAGLDMIAAVRLHLHDVNIAATTALQALAPDGRERGLLAGANVLMPNATDMDTRSAYLLYEGKPALDENAEACRAALDRSLAAIGERILYGERGDSAHFFARESTFTNH